MSPHPHRLPEFSYVGEHRYSLRFSTCDRGRLFVSDAVVNLVRSQFARAARELGFAIIAYCFMPDHVHLVAIGETSGSDCRRFIRLAKQYSGFYYARRYAGRLWQRYEFERVLRENEPTELAVRYILENPVRAGLVRAVRDYPFSGSFTHTLEELIDFAYASGSAVGQSG